MSDRDKALKEACDIVTNIQNGFRKLKRSAQTDAERDQADAIVGVLGDCVRLIAARMIITTVTTDRTG